MDFLLFKMTFFLNLPVKSGNIGEKKHDDYQVKDTIVMNKVFLYNFYICKHRKN